MTSFCFYVGNTSPRVVTVETWGIKMSLCTELCMLHLLNCDNLTKTHCILCEWDEGCHLHAPSSLELLHKLYIRFCFHVLSNFVFHRGMKA